MKPLLPAAVAAMLALCSVAMAAPADEAQANVDAQSAQAAPQSANERAGLPDLAAINRPPANVTSKVDINVPRKPSFHEKAGNGTEITEYRDKGKPVEIDVRSNFGTHYQMSAPLDTSPAVRDNGQASKRLPSVSLHY